MRAARLQLFARAAPRWLMRAGPLLLHGPLLLLRSYSGDSNAGDHHREMSSKRTRKLHLLLKDHGSCSREANDAFREMMDIGEADQYQLLVMLNDAWSRSDVQLSLLQQAASTGIPLNTPCYNSVLASLLIEGRDDEIQRVLEQMQARHLDWDERTALLLDGLMCCGAAVQIRRPSDFPMSAPVCRFLFFHGANFVTAVLLTSLG